MCNPSRQCVVCHEPCRAGDTVCRACASSCRRCARPLARHDALVCSGCLSTPIVARMTAHMSTAADAVSAGLRPFALLGHWAARHLAIVGSA